MAGHCQQSPGRPVGEQGLGMLLWHGCIGTLSPAFATLQWLGAEHNPRVICCSTHIWPDLLR